MVYWRLQAIDMLDGSEKVGEMIPKWVADAVLHRRFPVPPGLKCAFVLLPAEVCAQYPPSPAFLIHPFCGADAHLRIISCTLQWVFIVTMIRPNTACLCLVEQN